MQYADLCMNEGNRKLIILFAIHNFISSFWIPSNVFVAEEAEINFSYGRDFMQKV